MERLNQPITGICSFAKYPIHTDLESLEADIAVLGVPYDLGVGFLSGARLGPRRIREASTQYARGDAGFYDPETGEQYLEAPVRIVDCGDADVLHGDIEYSFRNIEWAVRKILERGVIPAVIGGDHSITIPIGRALECLKSKVSIIQFDAHLDWTDHVGPQYNGNGSPMRRFILLPIANKPRIRHSRGVSERGVGDDGRHGRTAGRSAALDGKAAGSPGP
ncbi:MAG TPA: arginase family protein [Syntrophales bacterium]|nr:arginase family protein [Syntrophales bacterium]